MRHKHVIVIDKILHILEIIIAILTLIVLIGMLGWEVYKMITVPEYITTIDQFLHTILTLVVGLEFVRMLIDLTPANTLEVLIVAISRQVILNHNDPLGNIACVLCIAGLFATRRFLIPKKEMKVEMSEVE
ncbi:MAG: hypothetical protein E7470_07385 [Ruminococcaceae bacterium]|nr:hypothetical protein [Oscillospiraceae bacterium]